MKRFNSIPSHVRSRAARWYKRASNRQLRRLARREPEEAPRRRRDYGWWF